MKLLLFNLLFFVGNFAMAQVGIDTNTPSANAALDVKSTNKGLMLPRVNDTTLVSSPSAGLVIFNKAVNAPAFHNGTQWNTLATQSTAASSGMDSITYTITNAAIGFTNGTFPVVSISNGASNPNTAQNQNAVPSNLQDLAFVKMLDINSIAISKAVATSLAQPTMVIEFKCLQMRVMLRHTIP